MDFVVSWKRQSAFQGWICFLIYYIIILFIVLLIFIIYYYYSIIQRIQRVYLIVFFSFLCPPSYFFLQAFVITYLKVRCTKNTDSLFSVHVCSCIDSFLALSALSCINASFLITCSFQINIFFVADQGNSISTMPFIVLNYPPPPRFP